MIEDLLAVILISSIFMSGVRRVKLVTRVFIFQSLAIGLIALKLGLDTGKMDYYILGLLTIVTKVIIIPIIINKSLNQLKVNREMDLIVNGFISYILTGIFIMISFGILSSSHDNYIKTGIALFIIGVLLMVARKKAITQMIGFLTFENGIVLFEISLTKMSLVIEAGIVFEGLLLALVMGIMIFHINKTFDSINTDFFENLKE
ncbi:hydrogenase [Clostridium akagii]|uniref:hydrogenase n=1 Tax=Clostridium akagii TaxID=91623 RepID=UPI0004787125|nr:hydrogenase [Clostridium akagii]